MMFRAKKMSFMVDLGLEVSFTRFTVRTVNLVSPLLGYFLVLCGLEVMALLIGIVEGFTAQCRTVRHFLILLTTV